MSFHLLALAAPLVLLIAAGFAALRPGFRPRGVPAVAEGAALVALAVAAGSVAVLIGLGPGTALSLRLDAVSATMLLLVAFVGWIVVRYSRTYLDGEARQGAFTGWLCATLAAVMLLVTAGSLVQLVAAWVAAGVTLHRLLLFYPGNCVLVRSLPGVGTVSDLGGRRWRR